MRSTVKAAKRAGCQAKHPTVNSRNNSETPNNKQPEMRRMEETLCLSSVWNPVLTYPVLRVRR